MLKELAIVLGLLVVLTVSGCVGNSLNSNPPDYIKTVSAVKEGDGLQIYFILADKNGQETTADGHFEVNIIDPKTDDRYWLKGNITKSDFQKVKLGIGALQHEGIIYNAGRVSYSKMSGISIPEALSGKVTVTFTTSDNRTLTGEDTVFF